MTAVFLIFAIVTAGIALGAALYVFPKGLSIKDHLSMLWSLIVISGVFILFAIQGNSLADWRIAATTVLFVGVLANFVRHMAGMRRDLQNLRARRSSSSGDRTP